jgi:hypothetical protein
VEVLQVPPPLREKIGDNASESLVMMFADAHKLATQSFERRLEASAQSFEHRLELEMSKMRLALSDLRFELLKWLFLFWVSQLAAFTWFAVTR